MRCALLWIPIAGLMLGGGALAAELSVGDRAPEFRLHGSDGKEYTLEGVLAEKQGVVLAWFPKAFTPG